MPFSSGIPIFSRIHVFVFRSVQLILSIRCHTHISKTVTSFSSHFFSAQLLTRIMRYSISVIVQVVSSGLCRCLLLSKSPSAVEQHVLQLWVLLLYLLCCCCQPWPSTPSIRTCSLFLFLCSLSTHFGFQYRQDLWPSYTSCWIVETHWSSTFLRPWHWSLTKNAAGDKETDKE